MTMCFAPTCRHCSEKHKCRFLRFPREKNELHKWMQMIRRKDRMPGANTKICSCHFKNGERKNGPGLTPSEAAPAQLKFPEKAEMTNSERFEALLQAEKCFFAQEKEDLKKQLQNITSTLSFRHIENKPHLITKRADYGTGNVVPEACTIPSKKLKTEHQGEETTLPMKNFDPLVSHTHQQDNVDVVPETCTIPSKKCKTEQGEETTWPTKNFDPLVSHTHEQDNVGKRKSTTRPSTTTQKETLTQTTFTWESTDQFQNQIKCFQEEVKKLKVRNNQLREKIFILNRNRS